MVQAGEPGRTLANDDLLPIEAVTSGGLVARRALDARFQCPEFVNSLTARSLAARPDAKIKRIIPNER